MPVYRENLSIKWTPGWPISWRNKKKLRCHQPIKRGSIFCDSFVFLANFTFSFFLASRMICHYLNAKWRVRTLTLSVFITKNNCILYFLCSLQRIRLEYLQLLKCPTNMWLIFNIWSLPTLEQHHHFQPWGSPPFCTKDRSNEVRSPASRVHARVPEAVYGTN